MTEQEARIKRLKAFMYAEKVKLYNGLFDDLNECIKALEELSLYKQCGLCLIPADVYKKQCEKLDELEEKQIAKKPKKQEYKILLDEGWEYECPSCGAAIGVNKKDTLDLTQHETYCPECGQKLDWGNEDDRD